jgi:DNA-binding NarL/FixJ family response regulator
VAEAAAELELIVMGLRRLARLGGVEERRALARMLHARGLTQQQVAVLVGVSERTVRYYAAGGGTWASGG